MKVKSLFPTPLIMTEIEAGSTLLDALCETIVAKAADDPGKSHSNNGGWQSNDDFLAWSGSEGLSLFSGIRAILDQSTAVYEDGALQRKTLDWKFQVWANINWHGHSNDLHFHPASYWSGTFYVDDGGIAGNENFGGAIEFRDPRGAAPLMYAPAVKMTFDGCVSAGLAERIYPKTGQLLLFPSWLAHSVTAYTGSARRISVAFNCSLW